MLRIDGWESGKPLNLVYQAIFSLQLIDHFEIGHIALVQPVYQALLEESYAPTALLMVCRRVLETH